jgi:uncharacterized membrane protein YraQ (UPF0718 family)/copper chaperone CopZ
MDTLMLLLSNTWSVTLELAPWLLLGAVAAGLLHVLVPAGLVQRQLSGYGGVVKSVVLGVPLPLCSCGVIPAGIGLKRDGASDGASVGFLVATPQTGVDSILVSAGFLGWPFALAKVGAALTTGIAAGWLTESLGAKGAVEVPAPKTSAETRTWKDGVLHGVDVIRMIWGWLLFGIVLSAALSTWLPPDAFAGFAAQATIGAFVAVLLLSLPLYVCATASVPIAAALVAAGMPTGAAMVFLMAGPATNTATLGAVWRAFGARVLAVYLGTIIVGSIGFGLMYEQLFGALTVAAVHAHEHAGLASQLAAGVLVLSMVWFAWEDVAARIAKARAPKEAPKRELAIEGMSCGGCAGKLERQLLATEGVDAAEVRIADHRAVITGTIDLERIRQAVKDAGFEVVDA